MKIHEAYAGKKYVFETLEGIPVHRSSIYIPKSKSIVQRLMNYFSFVYSSGRTGVNKIGDVDIIMCESPPLFLGWLRCKAQLPTLHLDIDPGRAEHQVR